MAFRFRRSIKLIPAIPHQPVSAIRIAIFRLARWEFRSRGALHLKIEAGLVAVLMCFAASAVHAHDPRCDAPPYGDSQLTYNAIFDSYSRASKSQPALPPNLLTGMMQSTMKMACLAKFDGGDRTMFYQAGLSDRDIDLSGTATLTDAWFDSRNKALAHENSGNQSTDEERCSRPPYGDTVAKFKAFIAKYQSTDAVSLVSILERICRAKFDGGDRRALYTVGLTDQEIEAGSTVSLATKWVDVTVRALQGKPQAAVIHSPVSGSDGGRWEPPPPNPLSACESGQLRSQYITLLRDKIQNAWIKPPSATAGINCIVEVTQVPGGEVIGAKVTQCNGDSAVRQSIENAVYRASPLPDPPDQALFDRNIRLNFRPTE